MNYFFLEFLQPFPFTTPIQFDQETLLYAETLARKHNVWMLFYVQLQRYQKEKDENEVIQTFLAKRKTLFFKNIANSLAQYAVEKDVLSVLAAEKIPAIVLKGNAIARDIYKNENSRSSCDIDVLIHFSNIEHADAILSNTGYSRIDSLPLGFLKYRLHHATYQHKKSRTFVEIHWNFSIPGFFELTSEDIWDQTVCDEDGSLHLTPEMNIIMLLMHHHMHAFKQLKSTVDLYWAFYVYENLIDWQHLASKLHKIGLLKSTNITISQIRRSLERQSKKLTSLEILNRKLTMLRIAPVFLLDYFTINLEKNDSFLTIKDKFLFRFALDKRSNIFFSFTKTFFPSPKAIRELYNDYTNIMILNLYIKYFKWRLLGRDC